MTYGLVLVKGKSEKIDSTLKALQKIAKEGNVDGESGAQLVNVFLSFGWPDFVLMLKAKNIEQIRYAIGAIRERLEKHGDYIETSTIICSTSEELKEKRKEWASN